MLFLKLSNSSLKSEQTTSDSMQREVTAITIYADCISVCLFHEERKKKLFTMVSLVKLYNYLNS